MEHLLWTEKYRPKKIADCILPERLKTPFQEYVTQNNIPNLLLSGGAGVGKTTVAKALCNELDLDYIPNTPKEQQVEYAISNSNAFGGQNAVAVFKRFAQFFESYKK